MDSPRARPPAVDAIEVRVVLWFLVELVLTMPSSTRRPVVAGGDRVALPALVDRMSAEADRVDVAVQQTLTALPRHDT